MQLAFITGFSASGRNLSKIGGLGWRSLKKTKLLLIECNRVFREYLEERLRHEPDLDIFSSSVDAQELRATIQTSNPELVLLDRRAFADDGSRVLGFLRQDLPNAKLVLMDVHPSDTQTRDFLRRGVSGIVLRHASMDDLLKTIRSVSEGFRILPPGLPQTLITQLLEGEFQGKGSGGTAPSGLTTRELQVAKLIAAGFSNKAIANQLNISTATVKSHVRLILTKLEVETRLQVALLITNQRDHQVRSPSSTKD